MKKAKISYNTEQVLEKTEFLTKIEKMVEKTKQQRHDFMNKTCGDLIPPSWFLPENKEKLDKFFSLLDDLVCDAMDARYRRLDDLHAKCDSIFYKVSIPLGILIFFNIFGFILSKIQIVPSDLEFVFLFASAFLSICGIFCLRQERILLDQSQIMLDSWCLPNTEEKIKQEMKKFVDEN